MRRDSTNQRRGPAAGPSSAAPRAARQSSSSMGMTVVLVPACPHGAGGRVVMIVAMGIDGKLRGELRTEHGGEGGITDDRFGVAHAADVTVDANDAVRGRHDDVEIVAD